MTTNALRSISLPVAEATVIAANRLVKVDSNGNAVPIAATGDDPVGVARKGSTDSQSFAIGVALLDGAILEIEADGTVTAGQRVTMRANGQIRNAVSGNKEVGTALTSGSSGDLIEVATTIALANA